VLLSPIDIKQCGVPKKGHVCPYQPKLTRRPGEPLPEMRCAAIQVEMDEVSAIVVLEVVICDDGSISPWHFFVVHDTASAEPKDPRIS
jgi:hypothetical protein